MSVQISHPVAVAVVYETLADDDDNTNEISATAGFDPDLVVAAPSTSAREPSSAEVGGRASRESLSENGANSRYGAAATSGSNVERALNRRLLHRIPGSISNKDDTDETPASLTASETALNDSPEQQLNGPSRAASLNALHIDIPSPQSASASATPAGDAQVKAASGTVRLQSAPGLPPRPDPQPSRTWSESLQSRSNAMRTRKQSPQSVMSQASSSTISPSQSSFKLGTVGTVKSRLKKMRTFFSASTPTILGSAGPAEGSFMQNASIPNSSSFLDLKDLVTVSVYLGNSMHPIEATFEVSYSGKSTLEIGQAVDIIYEAAGTPSVPSVLYYFDLKHPGLRVEAQESDSLDELLHSRSDWRLIPNDMVFSVNISLPNSEKSQLINYQRGLTVGDAVAQVADIFELKKASMSYNFFVNSNVGYWLDEKRMLSDYEIKPGDKVELRANSETLYVRVSIPELETRIVVKSPPHFTAVEFISLIMYSLKSKNLTLQHEEIQYSLWMPAAQAWMKENETIGEYGSQLSIREISDCGIEFRLHTLTMDVARPITRKFSCVNVSEKSTMHDVATLLTLDECASLDDDLVITSLAGEDLDPLENAWDMLRQVACLSDFLFRSRLRPIQITSSMDLVIPNSRINVDLDLTRTLLELLPGVARKIGVRPEHIRSFYLSYREDERLLMGQPLIEMKLRPLDLLVVDLYEEKWKEDAKRLASMWKEPNVPNAERGIWAEGPDSPSNVIIKDGALQCATLNKLIEKMTADVVKDFGEYTSLVQTFFLTYHSFTTATKVLDKLIERYHVPRLDGQTLLEYDRHRINIQSRVCNVIKLWTRSYTTCFFEESGHTLIRSILSFTEAVMAHDKQFAMGKQIRRNLFKLATSSTDKARKRRNMPLPLPKVPRIIPGQITIFIYDPEEIARQFSCTDFVVYRRIKPTELLNQAWTKQDAQTRAPNIWIMTHRFNSLVRWLARSLLQTKDIHARAARMEWMVDVASYLIEFKNFFTLMAILACLNSAAISRLKHTHKNMSTRARKKLVEIEEEMSPKSSFKRYRDLFHGSRSDGNVARIPYLTVHLSNLVSIEDGNADTLHGLINFAKRKLVYEVITDILQYQDEEYHFALIGDVQRLITLSYVPQEKTEEEMFRASLDLEPRGWDGSTPITPSPPPAPPSSASAAVTPGSGPTTSK